MPGFMSLHPWQCDNTMANAALFTSRAAGTGIRRLLEFVDSGTREVWFEGQVPEDYTATDTINIRVLWRANTVTSGAAVWDGALESITPDADDLDSDSLGTVVQASATTTADVAGEVVETVITLDVAGELDSLAAGETFRIRIRRLPGDAGDTLGEVALLYWVSMDWD